MDRTACRRATAGAGSVTWGEPLLQSGMGGCPWRTAVASMLCVRTRRYQAEPVLRMLLEQWPSAADLARASAEELYSLLQPLGLARSRVRQLQRFSVEYLADWWDNLEELTGVGTYVGDAVELVCNGARTLRCSDTALHAELQRRMVL